MDKASETKGAGYLSSTLSVVLLAVPGLASAAKSPWLIACLTCGVAASIIRMAMRWRSHQMAKSQIKSSDDAEVKGQPGRG